jgi:putative endonuclease
MAKEHRYFVYILASQRNGTLYVGVTNDVVSRTAQHRDKCRERFTSKYNVHMLVWFEEYADIHNAIRREKQIKKWNRAWKLELIEKANPDWVDLFERVAG